MNQRVTSPGTATGRRAWLFLSLLLPAFAGKVNTPNAAPLIRADADAPPYPQDSRPYLRVINSPPLRFEDLPPPPDLAVRPPASGPPKLPETEKDKDKTGPDVVLPKRVSPAKAAAAAAEAKANEIHVAAPVVIPPPAILPDDVPSQVRPEDFLPYFQYPGMGRRARSDAPAANPPPPASTATYNQEQ
jgi:hypothetical protein